MKNNLIDCINTKTTVLVDFRIAPVARHFERSLFEHLLTTVDVSGDPEQSVNVMNAITQYKGDIDTIQYQFGSTESADQDRDYIAENIEREFLYWLENMGGYDAVCPR
jgi:hypothetical protein